MKFRLILTCVFAVTFFACEKNFDEPFASDAFTAKFEPQKYYQNSANPDDPHVPVVYPGDTARYKISYSADELMDEVRVTVKLKNGQEKEVYSAKNITGDGVIILPDYAIDENETDDEFSYTIYAKSDEGEFDREYEHTVDISAVDVYHDLKLYNCISDSGNTYGLNTNTYNFKEGSCSGFPSVLLSNREPERAVYESTDYHAFFRSGASTVSPSGFFKKTTEGKFQDLTLPQMLENEYTNISSSGVDSIPVAKGEEIAFRFKETINDFPPIYGIIRVKDVIDNPQQPDITNPNPLDYILFDIKFYDSRRF